MPNRSIYLNTIKAFEEEAGLILIDREDMMQKLQEAWRKDNSQAKLDYLDTYRALFRDVLKKWSDNELSVAFQARSATKPNLKNCLLNTDQTLKLCAMSLIPELRENEDVLSHMTFGVIEPTNLKDEFVAVRTKYLNAKTSENAMKQHKADVYNKYQGAWKQTLTRKITELVWDQEALHLMSQEEKCDYALALETYREEGTFDTKEKGLIDDALQAWKQVLAIPNEGRVDEFLGGQYYQYAQEFGKPEWVEEQVNEAIAEYNKTPDPAKQEIAHYKEVETQTAERRRARNNPTTPITDDVAEAFGEFFMQEELPQEIAEAPIRKERVFFQEKVEAFNKAYTLTINSNKLLSSIEQLSALMIKASEEKRRYLSENSVVVIENGKETCYDAKEYHKEIIQKANEAFAKEVQRIEEERNRVQQEHKIMMEKFEQQIEVVGKEEVAKLKKDQEKALKEKVKELDKDTKRATEKLKDDMSVAKGGIVIEKNGNKVKEYQASKYYETHETKKEQYAYGEYQRMFSRIFKDACKNIKEQNYPKGLVSDFSAVARDLDKLCKSAMYISNIYDDEKNMEIIQKCTFGAIPAERLASTVEYIDGDSWAKEQFRDELWSKQTVGASKVLARWGAEAKKNPKVKPAVRIKETLEQRLTAFNKGECTKKVMLDYMLAAESHLQTNYPSNFKRMMNFIQYNRVNDAVLKCRKALGLTEMMPLRSAMNSEYARLATYMSKEKVFKGIETRRGLVSSFKDEKLALEKEHQIVQDREVAKKVSALENLKALGREPISIPKLDERRIILYQEPRTKPIVPGAQLQPNLNKNK